MIACDNDKNEFLTLADGPSDVWRLCENYTIAQAAMLVAGHDASHSSRVERLELSDRPPGYEAAKNALIQALQRDSWFGRLVELNDTYKDKDGRTYQYVDVEKSIVWSHSVKSWLAKNGVSTGFFFPAKNKDPANTLPDYLDPSHPRYTPKLAAAVRAWQVFTNAEVPSGKSAKQALTDWLMENANGLGLVDKAGNPNASGIEEVAKVANWQTAGGAPKTPSSF